MPGEAKVAVKQAARLREKYLREIRPYLAKQFGHKNPLAVARLEKVVINAGVGKALQDAKLLDYAVAELARITGQRPRVTRARRSIAAFKLKAGMSVGCKVTLRGDRMYEFMDRLVNVALPRVRDFRGVPPRSFDGRGSYTLGIKEHVIFPESSFEKPEGSFGMNVTAVTTARTDAEARELLRLLGMPFREEAASAVGRGESLGKEIVNPEADAGA